jgi:hypothetical protein
LWSPVNGSRYFLIWGSTGVKLAKRQRRTLWGQAEFVDIHPDLEIAMRKSVINVELFGMPRVVAGTRSIKASGTYLGDVLQSAVEVAPTLRNYIIDDDGTWLNPAYTFVVDGQFTNDPNQAVSSESDVLLVARASGG